MNAFSHRLRQRYSFSDYLFYTCLLAVPFVTAALGIGRLSLGGLLAYAILGICALGLLLRYYCSHCPHYTRDDKLLRCLFFWNLPKFFVRRPGNLTTVDTIVAWTVPMVMATLPLSWLHREPGLLVVYGLSLAGFAAAVRRHECHRCIYYACPLNTVQPEVEEGQDSI